MEAKLLTVEEVADILHCSKRYVYRLTNEEHLPCLRIGKKFLIPSEELDKWIRVNCSRGNI